MKVYQNCKIYGPYVMMSDDKDDKIKGDGIMHTKCPECDLVFTPEELHTEMHINSLIENIEKLEAENVRYRAALEFYADDESCTDDCSIARKTLKGE